MLRLLITFFIILAPLHTVAQDRHKEIITREGNRITFGKGVLQPQEPVSLNGRPLETDSPEHDDAFQIISGELIRIMKPMFDEYLKGNYGFYIYNVVVNEQGMIVYYEFDSILPHSIFSSGDSDSPLSEAQKTTLNGKIRATLDEMNVLSLVRREIPYPFLIRGFSGNIAAN